MGLMRGERQREFDVECWRLARKNYSIEYVARRTGATVAEVASAIRRVECGRYGSVERIEGGRP